VPTFSGRRFRVAILMLAAYIHRSEGGAVVARFQNISVNAVDGAPIAGQPPSADRVGRSVARVLGETGLCAWATVTQDGRAHINLGYFAQSADFHLYLLSHPASLHCRNVATNASMAVAVFVSPQDWNAPGRGIQLFGSCTEVGGRDVGDAERVYGHRYTAYAAWKAALKPDDPAGQYRFYRFVPERVKILDEVEFGDAVFVQAEIVRG
jgi:uncharacterized protein YhbP (UPF0306 family)